jgi:hypothetical protein
MVAAMQIDPRHFALARQKQVVQPLVGTVNHIANPMNGS